MTYKDPERKDLPSGSKFASYSQCAIKFQLELLAPPEKPSRFAASGTRSHKAMTRKSKRIPGLSQDEMDTVDLARDQEEELLSELGGNISYKEYREKRLFYLEDGAPLFTVCPDVVYVFDDEYKTAFIPDYKLGFLEVPSPNVNLQLLGSAVAVWQKYGSQRAYVTIIQPRIAKWYTPALYELSDLQAARSEIKALMVAIHSPDAKANPSAEACRHCSAKLISTTDWEPIER